MLSVRHVLRRVPLLALVAWIAGMLCILGSFVLFGLAWGARLGDHSPGFQRLLTIELTLIALSMAFSGIANSSSAYSLARSQGVAVFLLRTWQSLACIITLLLMLPVCVLALALFVPLSPVEYFSIGMLAAFSILIESATYLWPRFVLAAVARRHRTARE